MATVTFFITEKELNFNWKKKNGKNIFYFLDTSSLFSIYKISNHVSKQNTRTIQIQTLTRIVTVVLTDSPKWSSDDKSVKSEASWILTRRPLNSEFCWRTWLRLFFKFIMLWLLTLEGTWTSLSMAVFNLSLSVFRLKAKVFKLLTTEIMKHLWKSK